MYKEKRTQKDLFDYIIKQVSEIANNKAEPEHKSFIHWFSQIFFYGDPKILITDDSGDGKIDAIIELQSHYGSTYAVINSKFTHEYNKKAPVNFYDEITTFRSRFINKELRTDFLTKTIKEGLREYYKKVFSRYDDGIVDLYFITNHSENEKQSCNVKFDEVRVYHLENLLYFTAEYLRNGMPHTPDLLLTGIEDILPAKIVSGISTNIIFARVSDFIKYHEDKDSYDLLFSRNVRLDLGKTEPNKAITQTFENNPDEFVYSNNGVILICDDLKHDPGKREVTIKNPRVVNGSQTLHSVRHADKISNSARVMVRIHSFSSNNKNSIDDTKRDFIDKISIRSNLQNPIKRSDLCANDDFQYGISRYFKQYGVFYERRRKEWNMKKIEFKSNGYNEHISSTLMMQLLSCIYYKKSNLGPAIAKREAGALFEDDRYNTLKNTDVGKAYTIYCLHRALYNLLKSLAKKRVYINNIFHNGYFMIFTCVYTLFKDSPNVVYENQDSKKLMTLLETIVSLINKDYSKVAGIYKKDNRQELTYINYFKNAEYIKNFLEDHPTNNIKIMAQKIIS